MKKKSCNTELSIALTICTLFAHVSTASIDVYDGTTYNIDGVHAVVLLY